MYRVLHEETFFTFRFPSGILSKRFSTAEEAFEAASKIVNIDPDVERHSVSKIQKVK